MDNPTTIAGGTVALLTAVFGLLTWIVKQIVTDHKSERESWMKFLETHATDEIRVMTELRNSITSLTDDVRSWNDRRPERRQP